MYDLDETITDPSPSLLARLIIGASLIFAIGACAAASSVSPATRDTIVKTALDEAKYQCVTNPPNDARLQAACLALLPVESDGGLNVEQGNAVRSVGDGGE